MTRSGRETAGGSARFDRDQVADAVVISEVARHLGIDFDPRKSNAARGDFWAACPFHQELTPSFHVDDRKGFFFCFGCGAKGSVFDLVMEIERIDFPAALARVAALAGLEAGAAPRRPTPAAMAPDLDGAADRLDRAMEIWAAAEGREGEAPDLLARYLRARGVDLEGLRRVLGAAIPPTLRLHPALPCREAGVVLHRGPASSCTGGRRWSPWSAGAVIASESTGRGSPRSAARGCRTAARCRSNGSGRPAPCGASRSR